MKYVLMVSLLAATLVVPAHAQQNAADHSAHQAAPAAAIALSEGEIRKVDRDSQKITIRHGPITNLGMPPMTMVFQVKDLALLDKAKTGDKVRFAAEQSGGTYFVTKIESAK